MENKPDELFSIRINKTGVASIRRLAGLMNALLILSLISWSSSVSYHIYTYLKYDVTGIEYTTGDGLLIFCYKYSHWVLVAYMIIWLFQWLFVWKFIRGIVNGLRQTDEELFNRSFRKLNIGIALSLMEMSLGILLSAMYFYVTLKI